MMEPPPFLPVLADIPMPVAIAFMRAFGPTHGQRRPTPTEWVTLLEEMQKNFVACKTPAHFYFRQATSCPWCRFDAGFGTVVFLAKGPKPGDRSTFELDLVLSRINYIANPGPAPDLASMIPATNIRPSAVARGFQSRRIMKKVAGISVAALSVFLMMNKMGWAFFGFIPAGILFFSDTAGANDLKAGLTKAQHDWDGVLGDWAFDAGAGRFDRKKDELLETARKYRELPSVERDMLQQLELRKRELQMREHLESKKIGLARIPNIGDSRTTTLRSFGIQTAFDVTKSRVMNVPGFGPLRTDNLLSWRREMEAAFIFNPNQPTDPVEVAKVRSDIAKGRVRMESELLGGPGGLEAIRSVAMGKRSAYADHTQLYMAFRRAQVDVSVI
jgi:DNA-binding helix-hairpin-helix protein with protein kinase domain